MANFDNDKEFAAVIFNRMVLAQTGAFELATKMLKTLTEVYRQNENKKLKAGAKSMDKI